MNACEGQRSPVGWNRLTCGMRVALALSLAVLWPSLGVLAAERPLGFRGIRWGAPVEKVPGLQLEEKEMRSETFVRPSDDREVLGSEAVSIKYLAAEGKIVGVNIDFGKGRHGFSRCADLYKLEMLQGLFGRPDDSQIEHTNRGQPNIFLAHRIAASWYATRDEEASIYLRCNKEPSVSSWLFLMWKAHDKVRSGL